MIYFKKNIQNQNPNYLKRSNGIPPIDENPYGYLPPRLALLNYYIGISYPLTLKWTFPPPMPPNML